ncbi:MAG: HAD family hydrolase [Myxococcota bacterium]
MNAPEEHPGSGIDVSSGSRSESSPSKAAAFYDMDGTLVRSNLLQSYLYLARREPSLPESVWKTAIGIAKIPAFAWTDRRSRMRFNEMLFSGFKDCFVDNLLEIADEHFEEFLKPNLFPGAVDLVERGRKNGLRLVIVSGSLDFLVAPLARWLEVDDIITNRLEVVDGMCTGRAQRPLVAGAAKARYLREYAEHHHVSLGDSFAFSDSYSDLPMLSVVGRPAAVHPDRKLRAAAAELRWPVLTLEDPRSRPPRNWWPW